MNRVAKGYHCDEFSHFASLRAQSPDISTVYIWFSVGYFNGGGPICQTFGGKCVENISDNMAFELFVTELCEHILALRSAGKRVVVALPFPTWDHSVPDLQIRNAVLGLTTTSTEISTEHLREVLATSVTRAGAEVFDPRLSLCAKNKCIYQVDGVSIYGDSGHIASSQLGLLRNNLRTIMTQR